MSDKIDMSGLTSGQRGIIKVLQAAGIEVNRESYIACAWNSEPPDPWGAEEEDELPAFLQDWGKVASPVLGDDDEGAQS